MNHYDCVVVGLGSIGIGTIRNLSNSNLSILGVDLGNIVNRNATSYGQSRLIRLAYENESYVPILKDALKDWKELEKMSNNKLLYNTGTYKIGHPSGSRLSKSIDTCENRNVELQRIELSSLPKIFNINEKYDAIYQDDSGILDAQTCLNTQVKIAKKNGVKLKSNTKVKNWKIKGNKIHIKTDSKDIISDQLVITTGAWAYDQFEYLRDKINLQLHTYTHFIDENRTNKKFGFTMETKEKNPNLYGLVEPKSNAFKIGVYGEHDKKLDIKPENFVRGYNSKIQKPEMEEGISLFNIKKDQYKRDSCMISETKDDNPIVDYINRSPDILIGVGMSGHGFKYSNIIGKLISSMVTNKYDFNYDIPNFKLSRF